MKNKTLAAFVNAINTADADALYDLMSADHLFIDAHDNRQGREAMKQGWPAYFAMFPDYKIEVEEVLERGNLYCIFGYASGTYKNLKDAENSNYWRRPAAWKAIVENGKIKLWQVYCDNVIVLDIIKRVDGKEWEFKD